jgi:hypothetical protein
VSGPPVSAATQESLGLLTLNTPTGGCSAALLTNEWAITAAHCIDPPDISNPAQVTLTANWSSVQTRQAKEIRSFGPTPDIALIRVGNPFRVQGRLTGYFREIAREEDYYGLRTYGRGISVLATGSGASARPTQSDGQYRSANTSITKLEQYLYWYPRNKYGQIVAGGDSGGPTFANVWGRTVLLGVHATCNAVCLRGQTCAPGSWTWISDIPECGDAPVYSIYDKIVQAIREPSLSSARDSAGRLGGSGVPSAEGTSNQPLKDGRFDTSTPAPGAPAYIYAVRADGNLEWHRHDGAEQGLPQWQSPVPVGGGWGNFKHVFTGGKNIIYAINQEGNLLWYRHDTAYGVRPRIGRRTPPQLIGPRVVGAGWQNFRHVFSAGNGIIYAIDQGGNLLWYKHKTYLDAVEMPTGGGSGLVSSGLRLNWARSWEDLNPRVVGTGWGDRFKHVFSGGDGIIYAVTQDGTLQRYRHVAYLNGRGQESPGAWEGPVIIRNNWGDFQYVFSRGDGIIYAVAANGDLFWFKERVRGNETAGNTLGKRRYSLKKIGDGWGSFLKVFALLPGAADVIR